MLSPREASWNARHRMLSLHRAGLECRLGTCLGTGRPSSSSSVISGEFLCNLCDYVVRDRDSHRMNVVNRCPLCQDYMHSIARTVNPEALKRAGVSLVIIGNGSAAMIKAYRRKSQNTFHRAKNSLYASMHTFRPRSYRHLQNPVRTLRRPHAQGLQLAGDDPAYDESGSGP